MVSRLKKTQNIAYVFKVILLIVSFILFCYIRLSHNSLKNIFSVLLVLCILLPFLVRKEKSFSKTLLSSLCFFLIIIFQCFFIFKQDGIRKTTNINVVPDKESQIEEILDSSFSSYFNSCFTDTGNKIYCEKKAKETQERLRICFSKYSVNKFSTEDILKRCSLDYLKEKALKECTENNIVNENKDRLEYICNTYAECLIRHYEKGNPLNKANEICLEGFKLKNSMKK